MTMTMGTAQLAWVGSVWGNKKKNIKKIIPNNHKRSRVSKIRHGYRLNLIPPNPQWLGSWQAFWLWVQVHVLFSQRPDSFPGRCFLMVPQVPGFISQPRHTETIPKLGYEREWISHSHFEGNGRIAILVLMVFFWQPGFPETSRNILGGSSTRESSPPWECLKIILSDTLVYTLWYMAIFLWKLIVRELWGSQFWE